MLSLSSFAFWKLISTYTSYVNRISEQFSEMHLQILLNELEEMFDWEEHWKNIIEKKSGNVSYHVKCCETKVHLLTVFLSLHTWVWYLRVPYNNCTDVTGKDGGPTKYISTTNFEKCTTELLIYFYMDNEFWKEWNKTVVEQDHFTSPLVISPRERTWLHCCYLSNREI